MARHEADFRAVAEAELAASELRTLASGDTAKPGREDALARFLSCHEDWADALQALGGAFASEPGLRDLKRD